MITAGTVPDHQVLEGEISLQALKDVLNQHRIVSQGMTYQSPDTCLCGVRTVPARGDSPVEERRHEAFTAHVEVQLEAAARQVQADLLNDLAQYATDNVGTDGAMLVDLNDQQSFDDTASWLRYRASLLAHPANRGFSN